MKSEKNNKLEIKISDSKTPLSKEQVAFNRLTERIRKLEKRNNDQKDCYERLLKYYTDNLYPFEVKTLDLKTELLYLIDDKSNILKLPKKLSAQVEELIIQLLDEILENRTPDEKLSALDKKYNGYEEEFDDVEEEDFDFENIGSKNDEQKIFLINMFVNMVREFTGNIIDPQIFLEDDPSIEELQKRFHQYLDDLKSKQEKQKERKKTKKQLEREEAEKEKNKLKGQSLRTIFLGLAKTLHPDTETDPYLKMEKEEYMKRVTHAYEEKNLSALLTLEMQWVSKHNESLSNTPTETLKHFISLLKDQVQTLEKEFFTNRFNPRYEKIIDFEALTEKQSIWKMGKKRKELNTKNEQLKNLTTELQDAPKPKEILKKCVEALLIEEDFFDDDFLNFMVNRF